MKSKNGVTLAESLIALIIIGVLAAILIRVLTLALPDRDKTRYVKAYQTLEVVIGEIINDPSLYSQTPGSDYDDFSKKSVKWMYDDNNYITFWGSTDHYYNQNSLFCLLVASKLNIIDLNCYTVSPSFVTSDGIFWYNVEWSVGTQGPITIVVDVNGDKADGQYQILVYKDGKVAPPNCSTTCSTSKYPTLCKERTTLCAKPERLTKEQLFLEAQTTIQRN